MTYNISDEEIKTLKYTESIGEIGEIGEILKTFKSFELLGHGSFGYAYKVLKDEKEQILKIMKKTLSSLYEINILDKLKHNCKKNNILCFKSYEIVNDYILLYTDYIKSIDLFDALIDGSISSKPINDIIDILLEISKSIKYLHDNNVVHLDLKPENMLYINDTQKVIILDFGVSCVTEYINNNYLKCSYSTGTAEYIAPELVKDIKDKDIDYKKCDIFSLGCIFVNMWKNISTEPIQKYAQSNNNNRIKNDKITKYIHNIPYKNLLYGMLKIDPNYRYNINDVISDILNFKSTL